MLKAEVQAEIFVLGCGFRENSPTWNEASVQRLSAVLTYVESTKMSNCVIFFPADFGDYDQFESHDFLREYVLFPMVSSLSLSFGVFDKRFLHVLQRVLLITE